MIQVNKVLAIALISAFMVSSCSTSGGVYDPADKKSEFSLKRTIVLAVGIAAAVAASKSNSGGSYYSPPDYAWDYQPANAQWVCRDKSNGQYAKKENCDGKNQTDATWPG
jgi:hypothetical protein